MRILVAGGEMGTVTEIDIDGRQPTAHYNQMARDRVMTSAYSIRPVAAATVSAPLRWEELDDVSPQDFTVATMPGRFAEVGDLWAA